MCVQAGGCDATKALIASGEFDTRLGGGAKAAAGGPKDLAALQVGDGMQSCRGCAGVSGMWCVQGLWAVCVVGNEGVASCSWQEAALHA